MPGHTWGAEILGLPGAAALCAEASNKHIPATLFREKITELADEYDRMQETLWRVLQQRADGLIGDGPRADAPLPESKQAAGAEFRELPRTGPEAFPGVSLVTDADGAGALATQPSGGAACRAAIEPGDSKHCRGAPRAESQAGPQEDALNSAPLPVESSSSSPRSQGDYEFSGSFEDAPPRKRLLRGHTFRTRLFQYVAHSAVFQRFIGLVIVLNVIFLGVATDVSMSFVMDGGSDTVPASFQFTEAGFLGIYAVELTIRLMAFGKNFFFDANERGWNIFDMALLVQGVLEQFGTTSQLSGSGNLSFLRMMRLLKTVKMLRVVRLMRSMKELRMIIYTVMGSVKSMMWSCVMLGVVLYTISLICVQGVVGHLQMVGVDERQDGTYDDMLQYWGSVPTGMLTLFMSSSGGTDWDVAFEALSHAGPLFGIVFLLYVLFFMFVMMNAITSLFVEAIMEHASKDWHNRVHEQLENKRTYASILGQLFRDMDANHDCVVSLEEFERKLEDPKVGAFFESKGIHVRDASRFFEMLSQGGAVKVDLERFIDFCIRMSGPALSIDLAEVMISQSSLLRNVRDAKQMQEAQLVASVRIREAMDYILSRSLESGDGPLLTTISDDRPAQPQHLGQQGPQLPSLVGGVYAGPEQPPQPQTWGPTRPAPPHLLQVTRLPSEPAREFSYRRGGRGLGVKTRPFKAPLPATPRRGRWQV